MLETSIHICVVTGCSDAADSVHSLFFILQCDKSPEGLDSRKNMNDRRLGTGSPSCLDRSRRNRIVDLSLTA
jgi:hypothetical protein